MSKKSRARKRQRSGQPQLTALTRTVFTFYEKPEDAAYFQKMLNAYVEQYRKEVVRDLPDLNVSLRSIDMPELEKICKEERCQDVEMLVQCHFLEIYKICPADLVVAIGPMAQMTLRELKKRAHSRPDQGARFLTLAEVVGALPLALNSEAAYELYFRAMARRLFTV